MRIVSAALIGMLCWAGWFASIQPATDAVCGGRSLECLGIFLLMLPVLAVASTVVGWGLLKLARFDPAWPTAIGGMVGGVGFLLVSGVVGGWLGVTVPQGAANVTFAAYGAAGYALAAATTARYRGSRDRTQHPEHRGQDR